MSDPDETVPSPETETTGATSLSFMSRRLQAFGSPDLEVVLGQEERVFHYHSFILASQSLYVDTLLSSPAAKREQEKCRINFPDIEIATWEKMIDFISPTSVAYPTVDDLIEIIPLYDKYQFMDALEYCDNIISKLFTPGDDYMSRTFFSSITKKLPRLIALIWQLNFFPISKPLFVKWAKEALKHFHSADEEMIHLLIPLVENDTDLIKSMVSTYLGRMSKGMTMNEMRDMITQPDFAKQCILRSRQISQIDDEVRCLKVMKFHIYDCRVQVVNGQYERRESSTFYKEFDSEFAVTHGGGASKFYWAKKSVWHENEGAVNVFLASLDVFGSVWEIYTLQLRPDGEDESNSEEGKNKRVLLRWDNGILTSSVPPKHGWKVIVGNENEASDEDEMQVDYYLGLK